MIVPTNPLDNSPNMKFISLVDKDDWLIDAEVKLDIENWKE